MAKEIDWDNPWIAEKEVMKLGAHMGVSQDGYWQDGMGSQDTFDYERYAKDVETAYANDYSTRRALEAASLAGEDVPKGIGSLEDAYFAKNWMEDQHGGGGKYSSHQDRANIADKWVNQDRAQLTTGFTSDLNEMKEKLMDQALSDKQAEKEEEEYVPSDRLQGATDRLNTAANDPSSLYDKNNEPAVQTQRPEDAAKNFVDQSKFDLLNAGNYQPSGSNMYNAADYLNDFYYG